MKLIVVSRNWLQTKLFFTMLLVIPGCSLYSQFVARGTQCILLSESMGRKIYMYSNSQMCIVVEPSAFSFHLPGWSPLILMARWLCMNSSANKTKIQLFHLIQPIKQDSKAKRYKFELMLFSIFSIILLAHRNSFPSHNVQPTRKSNESCLTLLVEWQ